MSNHQQMKPLQHVAGEPSIKVLTNQEHSMLRAQITNSALKVISQLQQSGFQSYLVGGGVRDLLLGNKPKDFDIATDATPEEVRKIFRNCRLIGRRFRLAHVFFGNEIIEVATFRGSPREGNSLATLKADSGILLRDNVYGSINEDANRRDFTINAMYYNATSCSIRDYTYGMEDLGKQLVRLIGDPEVRYREDPVRMLRAIRFAVKLRFDIEEKTAEPIRRLSCLLHHVPSARLYEEYLKMIQSGTGLKTYHLMRKYGLFQELFPLIAYHFTSNHSSNVEKMLDKTFYLIDSRFREGRRPNIAFVFAAILWYPMKDKTSEMRKKKVTYHSIIEASSSWLNQVVEVLSIPRRHTVAIREIWQLQLRFLRRCGKQAFRLLEVKKFQLGFSFLKVRGSLEGGETQELANWWVAFRSADRAERQAMVSRINILESHKKKQPCKKINA